MTYCFFFRMPRQCNPIYETIFRHWMQFLRILFALCRFIYFFVLFCFLFYKRNYQSSNWLVGCSFFLCVCFCFFLMFSIIEVPNRIIHYTIYDEEKIKKTNWSILQKCDYKNSSCVNVLFSWCLVDFHIRVNFPYKETRSDITNRTANNAKRSTKQCHISKIKCRLEQAVHSVNKE